MRVALLHNPSAGSEDHSSAELSALIRRAGHDVVHVARGLGELTAALHSSACDVVIVAGGDGTVGKAACELAGWQVPLAILALGTANNTASSLKLPGRISKLVKGLDAARSVPFDLGVLSDGVLRQRFAEGVGWGVFPQAIEQAKLHPRRASVKRTIKRDRQRFCTIAGRAHARFYGVEVDGRDVSGEYLLVEVMNVPLLGPALAVSPTSETTDGQFDVVLVSEAERTALADLGASGSMPPGRAKVERGSRIRVTASEGLLHRDGKLVRHAPGERTFEIHVAPAAISYLHPEAKT